MVSEIDSVSYGVRVIDKLGKRIEWIAGAIILMSGWRRVGVVFLAGAISALAMPPFDLWFFLFFTFPVLAWSLDSVASEPSAGFWSRFKAGFKPGFFFGFGYFLAGLWWIGAAFLVEAESFAWALPIAVCGVPAILALFWGSATALARIFWFSDYRRLFILAASFAVFEYLRSFVATGLPWNSISYAVYFNPLTMQSASVFGIYGMTAFAVFVFASIAIIVPGSGVYTRQRKFVFGLSLTLIVSHIGFGIYRLPSAPSPLVEDVSLRIVQPNIDQRDKFDPSKEQQLFNTYLRLSTSAGENNKTGLSGTTHLIWPESAFPFFLTQRRDALAAISAMLPEGTSLITGGARYEAAIGGNSRERVFNSTLVVDHQGEIIAAADKTHLVPFGEYLPFQAFAESLGFEQLTRVAGGFDEGNSRSLINTGTGPSFLPLICYEIIFSGNTRVDKNGRPNWIINLTNDAWFGNTPGPYQHARQAVLRSVEEGVPVIRAANSGISIVTDAYGREIGRLELGEKGVLDAKLPQAINSTWFVQFGNFILIAVVLGFITLGMLPFARERETK